MIFSQVIKLRMIVMNHLKFDRYVIIALLTIIALQLVPENVRVFIWLIGSCYALLMSWEIIKEIFRIIGKKEE